jgi:parallel beta-helix repeat protein
LNVRSSAISGNYSGNNSYAHGGGLFAKAFSGSITIDRSTINLNGIPFSNKSLGAGVYLYSSTASVAITKTSITDNQASGNEANVAGLAVVARNSLNVLIDQVNITGNHADDDTGGLYIKNLGSDVTLTNSTISGNTASHHDDFNAASGVWLRAEEEGSETTIKYSTISGNEIITGPDDVKQNVYGAGLFIQAEAGTTTTILNTTISSNKAEGNGGGVKIAEGLSPQGGAVFIRHSTITNNRTDSDGDMIGTGAASILATRRQP